MHEITVEEIKGSVALVYPFGVRVELEAVIFSSGARAWKGRVNGQISGFYFAPEYSLGKRFDGILSPLECPGSWGVVEPLLEHLEVLTQHAGVDGDFPSVDVSGVYCEAQYLGENHKRVLVRS